MPGGENSIIHYPEIDLMDLYHFSGFTGENEVVRRHITSDVSRRPKVGSAIVEQHFLGGSGEWGEQVPEKPKR